MNETEGYLAVEYTWVNYTGYQYKIVEIDDGVWEIRYSDESNSDVGSMISFNDDDADGLINAIQQTVSHYRSLEALRKKEN